MFSGKKDIRLLTIDELRELTESQEGFDLLAQLERDSKED